jgi:hypothetical protein
MKNEIEVHAPQISQSQQFVATVRIRLKQQSDAPKILTYLRSIEVKNDLINGWAREHAPEYGMAVKGGPRPVFTEARNRETPVIAYEVDFEFTKRI